MLAPLFEEVKNLTLNIKDGFDHEGGNHNLKMLRMLRILGM